MSGTGTNVKKYRKLVVAVVLLVLVAGAITVTFGAITTILTANAITTTASSMEA